MNKDSKVIAESYLKKVIVRESSYEELFDWLGGTEDDITGGGLYPGVKGIEAVKNMILDTYVEEYPNQGPYIAMAIDVLNPKQLLDLILQNYDGTALKDLPSSVIEFHSGNDEDYFEAPDSSQAQNILTKAIGYFRKEPAVDLPEWAQKRDDAMDMRAKLVPILRKKHRR
jgi:hypothetical protein